MAAKPTPLIAGNWKMNGERGDGFALASALALRAVASAGTLRCELLICPPATLLLPVYGIVANGPVRLGAQDCHTETKGAYTGDISAAMLADVGCDYVIVGHSERRAGHGESDALVRAKASAAHEAGLAAIICVGETEAERDAGNAAGVVRRQVEGSVPEGATAANTVIAYEPVWAIGTGRTPTVAEIAEIHDGIRGLLSGRVGDPAGARILYGGSVKPDNAAGILALANVNGALVGGASLVAEDFWAIAQSCPSN